MTHVSDIEPRLISAAVRSEARFIKLVLYKSYVNASFSLCNASRTAESVPAKSERQGNTSIREMSGDRSHSIQSLTELPLPVHT